MIDWTKQSDDMVQAWTDTQKKLWSGWVDASAQQADQTTLTDTWRKTVDTWEAAVKNSLETQREWSSSVADSASAVPNVPQDLRDWAEQTQALGIRWNAAQADLWESYFGMIRKAVPVKMLGTVDDENRKLYTAWQESVEKVTTAHSAWAQVWTGQTAAAAADE